ncbi:unnamed protein product [Knipowitschia caucasica]
MAFQEDNAHIYGMQNKVHALPNSRWEAFPPPYGPPDPAVPSVTFGLPSLGPTIPPGMEYLTQIDQLLIQQIVNLTEVFCGWEIRNRYVIKNSVGQQVFTAEEHDIDCCTMQCCGPRRPFNIRILDNFNSEILTVTRETNAYCFPWFLQEVEIQSPPGVPIGYMVQNWHWFLPKFTLLDASRRAVLKIEGSFCRIKCCADVVFDVLSLDEDRVVGQISKQWAGFLQEGFTDANNFGVTFPMDLEVRVKALLLGAVFLIDFMYFQKSK